MSAMRTHADLADLLRLPLSTTIELRKREKWPHLKFGRAIRFTDEQVDQILASHQSVDQAEEQEMFPGRSAGKRGVRS